MCYTSSGNLPKNNMINKNNLRQKILLPTLKESQRYVVYAVKTQKSKKINIPKINELILKECISLMGIFEGAKAGLMNVKYDENSQRGIIRVNNKYVDKLKVCLGMIHNKLSDMNVGNINVDCIYVSGMLNKADSVMLRGVKNE